MNAPAPGESEDRFHELGRMPAGEELKIGTTPVVMPAAGMLFIAMGILFACMEYEIELYVGGFFAAVGVLALFYRECVILDRKERQIVLRDSLLLYVRQKRYPVADRAMIKITYSTVTDHEGRKSSSFDVRLVSFGAVQDDDEGQLVLSTENHPRARAVAEQAARFFGLGIADFSSGKALVRDAQAVNESLRDRLARYGRVPAMPARPAKCRIRERVAGDWVELQLPKVDRGLFGGNIGFAFVLQFLLGIAIGLKFVMFRAPAAVQDAGFFVVLGFGGLLVLSAAGYALFVLSFQERVRVGRQGLALLTSSIYTRRKRTIPSEKLEELFMGVATDSWLNVGREAVVARSDELSLEFGARLTDDERRWLRDVIFYLVTAPEGKA